MHTAWFLAGLRRGPSGSGSASVPLEDWHTTLVSLTGPDPHLVGVPGQLELSGPVAWHAGLGRLFVSTVEKGDWLLTYLGYHCFSAWGNRRKSLTPIMITV